MVLILIKNTLKSLNIQCLISTFYFFQISDSDANRSLTKHRKIASSFRDTQLFDIFQLSCTLLRTAYENRSKLNFNDESQHELLKQLLRLGHNCLTFDFIGTSTDESSDDLCTGNLENSI